MEAKVHLVCLVKMENPDCQDDLDLLDHRAPLERARWDKGLKDQYLQLLDHQDKWDPEDHPVRLVCLARKDMLVPLDPPVTLELLAHPGLRVKLVPSERTEKMVLTAHMDSPVKLDNLDRKVLGDSPDPPVFLVPKVTWDQQVPPERMESPDVTENPVHKVWLASKVHKELPVHPVNRGHEGILESLVMPDRVVLTVCQGSLVLPARWVQLDHQVSRELLDLREKQVPLEIRDLKVPKAHEEKMVYLGHLARLVFLVEPVWMEQMALRVQLVMLVHLAHLVFLVHEVHPALKATWEHLVSRVTRVFPARLASRVTKDPKENKEKWA